MPKVSQLFWDKWTERDPSALPLTATDQDECWHVGLWPLYRPSQPYLLCPARLRKRHFLSFLSFDLLFHKPLLRVQWSLLCFWGLVFRKGEAASSDRAGHMLATNTLCPQHFPRKYAGYKKASRGYLDVPQQRAQPTSFPPHPTILCQVPFLSLCKYQFGKSADFSGEFVVLLVLHLKCQFLKWKACDSCGNKGQSAHAPGDKECSLSSVAGLYSVTCELAMDSDASLPGTPQGSTSPWPHKIKFKHLFIPRSRNTWLLVASETQRACSCPWISAHAASPAVPPSFWLLPSPHTGPWLGEGGLSYLCVFNFTFFFFF